VVLGEQFDIGTSAHDIQDESIGVRPKSRENH